MKTLPQWFKHAFAIDPPEAAEPTDAERAVVEKLCVEVVRRRLTTPTVAFLEMARPLNFLGAQGLHFFAPMISAITDADGHRKFADFLERRGSIDYLCRRIEELEQSAAKPEGT